MLVWAALADVCGFSRQATEKFDSLFMASIPCKYRGDDKSLARTGKKQATATKL